MQSGQPPTPAGRDRAIGRLRSLTLGTTVAGLAGAIGFGVVAAVTQPGSAVSAGAPQVVATPIPTTRANQRHTPSDDGQGVQVPTLQAPAVLPAPVTRHGHVSTGTS